MAIANSDGSIILSTKVDTSGINKGMSQMQGRATSLTKTFSKLGAAIASAFAIQKIIQFSNEAGQLATQTEASVQRLVDIYGSASDSVGDFIDANARALGMSKAAAASFSSVYGNLFSVWADQATNAELTNRYLNMTAVVASKTGRTVEDVQERVRSGLLGNTEAIEDLGIFVNVKTIEMTDAFQRMANGKSWEQLDAYTQQQIRSMAILEQATAKYGDEVADTSATIRNRYKAAYEDFQNSWGNIVNTVLLPVLETLTQIFDIATKGLNALLGRSGQILENVELQEENTDKTAENIEEQTKNQKELNKELKKATASFDTIEILSAGTAQNANAELIIPEVITGSLGENLEIQETEKELSEFEKAFKEICENIQKAFEPLTEISFSNLGESLSSLIEPIKELGLVAWDILEDAIEKVISPLAGFVIEDALPKFFDTFGIAIDGFRMVLDKAWDILEQFIDEFLTPIWEYAEPKILEVWDNLNAKLKDFVKLVEESEAWEDFQTIMSDIYDVLEPVVKAIIDFVTPIIDFKMSQEFIDLEYKFKNLEDGIGAIADLINGDFDDAWQHLKELFIENFVDKGKEKFQAFSDVIEGITGFDLAQWVKDAWESVKQFWTEHIAPIFTKKWWEDLGKTCINGLIAGFEGGINGIIGAFESMINWIVDGLNKISFQIPDWVPGIGGEHWGVYIPKASFDRVSIPRLAQGTVVPPNKEFMAILGDNTKEHEIVSPVSTMKQAFMEAMIEMGGNFGGGNTEVILEIDGREFGRAVVEQGNRENRRIGTRLVTV